MLVADALHALGSVSLVAGPAQHDVVRLAAWSAGNRRRVSIQIEDDEFWSGVSLGGLA